MPIDGLVDRPRSGVDRRTRDRVWRAVLGPSWAAPTDDALRAAVSGRRILVTGASSGIGAATARRLGAAGADVVLTGRDTTRLAAAAVGGGRIDIVVSNAGRSIHRAASIERADDLPRSVAVNLLGPARLLLRLVPTMPSGGQVVHVGSVSADVPAPGWSAYTASKAAADAWFRCVAPEWRHRGIAVSTIRFGLVHTPMSAATYQRTPGLHVDDAAGVIARTIVTRRRVVTPWFARAGAALLRIAPARSEAVLARLIAVPGGAP